MAFLRSFLAMLGSVVAVYLAVVVAVDPRGEFGRHAFPWVVPNSRRVKVDQFRAEASSARYDGVVLGSSRAMKIDPNGLARATGLGFYNFAVFSGSADDALAIIRWLVRQGNAPRAVVVTVDQDWLEPGTPQEELLNNADLAWALQGRRGNGVDLLAHWSRLFKRSLRAGYAHNVARSVTLFLKPKSPINVFGPKGTLQYLQKESAMRAGTYQWADSVTVCGRRLLARMKGNVAVDPTRAEVLDQLLSLTDSIRARTVVWLPPVHPSVVRAALSDSAANRYLGKVEQTVRAIIARHGAQLIDLSDLSNLGVDPTNWFDCIHYADETAAKLTKAIADALVAPPAQP